MKIWLLFLALISAPLTAPSIFSTSSCPCATFIGSVVFPRAVTGSRKLIMYYKGSRIEVVEGAYELKEVKTARDFYLLCTLASIVPESACSEDPNTICRLCMPATTRYKCFKLNQAIDPYARMGATEKAGSWTVEPCKLEKKNNRLLVPENTLIILANPDYIDTIDSVAWKSHNCTFKFPTIVFKDSLSAKAFDSMHVKALLASLDLEPFHRKPTVMRCPKQPSPRIAVSMTTDEQ